MKTPKILITAGEPAGIGPEIVVKLAQEACSVQLIVIASKNLLEQTAARLKLPLKLTSYTGQTSQHQVGHLWLIDQLMPETAIPGQLNPANSDYVLATLNTAADMALSGVVDAILTGPVHKGVLNQTSKKGLTFSGHTEFFAQKAKVDKVVMMLATEGLRVALATTHLPLSQVAAAITPELLTQILRILTDDMQSKFGLARPRIMLLGLNPHAGEDGHLGREELDIIIPTLNKLKDQLNADLIGPVPADSGFKPSLVEQVDCILAMYHDQGLPALKYKGFGEAINLTLGLPFIRTSVDHGTGLDIAGKNQADIGSMRYALKTTIELIASRDKD